MSEQSRWLKRGEGWEASPPRWQRRLLVAGTLFSPVVYCLTAIVSLHPWRDYGGRLYGMAAAIYSLMAIGIGMFYLRLASRIFSRVSLEDRARIAYGRSYAELTVMERDRVKWASRQDWKEGSGPPDERDAAMRRDAEGQAFRMLKGGLPVLVLMYWGVCLSAPIGPVRLGLLFSAVAFSGLALVVLALPEVVRMWGMPDEVGSRRW